ncbi:MAG: hypothetical protein HYY65_10465 [Candidatus Tectomicrobia bacterium]|uniref:Uncharacterized protein n=1 Tax=Tectimicrobiota bacterium TaxID=2528274 RepID=A0A932GQQ2_UNCTE|nr:hypothetical protein [Candidatus Tectomicrobia bacterium]
MQNYDEVEHLVKRLLKKLSIPAQVTAGWSYDDGAYLVYLMANTREATVSIPPDLVEDALTGGKRLSELEGLVQRGAARLQKEAHYLKTDVKLMDRWSS